MIYLANLPTVLTLLPIYTVSMQVIIKVILSYIDNIWFYISLLNIHCHFCHFKLMTVPKGIRFETIDKTKHKKELHREGLKFVQKLVLGRKCQETNIAKGFKSIEDFKSKSFEKQRPNLLIRNRDESLFLPISIWDTNSTQIHKLSS